MIALLKRWISAHRLRRNRLFLERLKGNIRPMRVSQFDLAIRPKMEKR